MPKIVCLSDTHNAHDEIVVPDGDILLHAGDATNRGTLEEIHAFARWFERLPHKHKVLIAGNHDWFFEDAPAETIKYVLPKTLYLQDSFVEIDGLKIYGSPWQPRFYDWAFNLNRGAEIAQKWQLIPDDTDVLITHGPPFGVLDLAPRGSLPDENTGCEELIKVVTRIKPKLHVFGHIHHSYGAAEISGVQFANAANCNEKYEPVNAPLVFDL